MSICYHCQKEMELSGRAGRKDTCPFCGADLHCCRNCKFYDESAHNQCKEPNSEWVSDRERSNFCDYFSFTPLEQKSRHFLRQAQDKYGEMKEPINLSVPR